MVLNIHFSFFVYLLLFPSFFSFLFKTPILSTLAAVADVDAEAGLAVDEDDDHFAVDDDDDDDVNIVAAAQPQTSKKQAKKSAQVQVDDDDEDDGAYKKKKVGVSLESVGGFFIFFTLFITYEYTFFLYYI